MTDLDQAREWAECTAGLAHLKSEEIQAAVDVIQSLPDQWVDAEKLREVVSKYEGNTYISEIVQDFADLLPTPKLPTLADMTAEERQACLWVQAKTWHEVGILVWVDEDTEIAQLITRVNGVLERKFKDVTPLPGEPKMKWPGGVGDAEIVEEPETTCSGSIHTPMQPSEVPANEPWLIEVDGQKAIGTRHKGNTIVPWSVAALDGSFAGDFHDNEITLIHKLAPEPPALPEGMRLADHEEYGRVIVSPKADKDGEYMIFFPRYNYGENGSDYEYAHKSVLTFLSGDQHV